MAKQVTTGPGPTAPVQFRINAPGVVEAARSLDNLNLGGSRVLKYYNQQVQLGPEAATKALREIQSIASEAGYFGDVSVGATYNPAAATATPKPKADPDTNKWSQIGKQFWNSIPEALAGIARTPQIIQDAALGGLEAVGYQQSQQEKTLGNSVNEKLKSLGDFADEYAKKIQFDLDESGKYDKGLVSRNDSGDWEFNGIEGAAHSIGQSLGFVASMLIPGAALKGARALGVGTTALRAAKAAGDVDKVAQLTQRASATEKAMRYVGGVVSQVEPLYQDALEATGDSHTASRFTAVVAPVIAAIDAFTGVEASIAGVGKRQFTKEAVKEALRGLGKNVTEETFEATLQQAGKNFAQKYIGPRLAEGAKQFVTEGGTETLQEGYQMMVERLFDRASGNTNLSDAGGDADVRLLNAGILGGALGGGLGATLYRGGMYQPTAFKMLQDAYLDGGNVGLQAAMDELHQGRIDWRSEMPEHNDSDLHGQIEQMGSVIKSFQNPYQVDGKTQYQYFDLAYNQIPQHEQTATDLQERYDALTGEQPSMLMADEDGVVFRNEDGSPAQAIPMDPVVAETMAARLRPELTDQQRRLTYLNNARQQLAQSGQYQSWGKGFDVIGKFQEGDRVTGADMDSREDVTGTVAEISEDGQTLTIEVPGIDPESGPVRKTLRAIEAKEESNTNQPEPVQPTVAEEVADEPVAVSQELADGFTQHRDMTDGYQPGDSVVLANNINDTATITSVNNNSDNDPDITLAVPNGTVQPDVVTGRLSELLDRQNPNRILGRYSPDQAMNAETRRRQQSETAKTRTDLRSKVSSVVAAAIDRMNETQLTARYEAAKGDKASANERKYMEFVAQQKGWPITAPEATDQSGNAIDSLAVDTPTDSANNPDALLPSSGEVIDEQAWNQIIDTEQIPDEVMDNIAYRAITGEELSERQQLLFDNFDELDESNFLDRLATLTDTAITSGDQSTDDGQVRQLEENTPDSLGVDTGSQEGTGEVIPEGSGQESAGDVPDDTGSVLPELADPQPAESASPGSIPVAEVPTETAPSGTDGTADELASPNEAALSEQANQQVAEILAQNEQWQQAGTTQDTQQTTTPIQTTVVGEVGMPVRVGQSQRDGVITRFVGSKIEVTYQTRGGKTETFAFEPDLVRDSRGIRTVLVPEGVDTTTATATEASTQPAPTSIAPGDVVGVPGFSDTLVAEVIAINPETGEVTARVVVTGKEKTATADQVTTVTPKQIEAAQKKAKENAKAKIMRQREGAPSGDAIGREAINDWVARLKKAFPRVRVEVVNNDAMTELFGDRVLGAVQGGVVYINEDLASRDTPLHEFAHLYAEVLKKNQPQLYQRGLNLVKGTVYEQRVRELYPELTAEEDILEEAMVQAIGEKGASLTSPSKMQSFLTWLKAIIRRASEAINIPLSLETTLDEFAMNRSAELLSGRVVSMDSSEALARTDTAKQKGPVSVPPVVDESWIRNNTPGTALVANDIHVDMSTGELLSVKPLEAEETKELKDNKALLDRQGAGVKFISSMAPYLDPKNLIRQVFGEGEVSKRFNALIEQRLGVVSAMKVRGHDFESSIFEQLKTKTLFRGANSATAVERWGVSGTVDGKPATVQLPVDVVMKIAAMYRSTLSSHGIFDFRHHEKQKTGEKLTATFKVQNPANPDLPLLIELDKAELRRIEQQVFLDDDTTARAMQAWSDHSDGMFEEIDRTHTFVSGEPLKRAPFYFPITTAQTEKQLAQRSITQFVDDARSLRSRNGPAKVFDATNGFVQAVNRYQTDMENFVQLAPIWHNLDRMLVRHEQSLRTMGMKPIVEALENFRDGFAQPYKNRDSQLIQIGNPNFGGFKPIGWLSDNGTLDIGKLLRLATLSRFAFNIAIPLKQITGYFSAYGSGAIDSKYLRNVGGFYSKLIAESYFLVGRGGDAGHYGWVAAMRGVDTAFDTELKELRIIGSPESNNLVWRAQGSAHPDIQFDDWGAIKDQSSRQQAVAKLRSWFEEYGLSISQRADSAIVLALYRAAKLHVAEQSPNLSPIEQQKEAAVRAKQALYYSNQTFDKTDRASFQARGDMYSQLISLYKSQQFKIFNTMAGRTMDVAYAPDAEKGAARLRLAGNLGLNLFVSSLITTGIDLGVQSLRDLSKKDDKPEETDPAKIKEEEDRTLQDYMVQWASTISQALPGLTGDLASYGLYYLSHPESKRDLVNANPIKTVSDFIVAGDELASVMTTKKFKSSRQFEQESTEALQAVLRSGSVLKGIPTELIRQVNNAIGQLMLPDPKQPTPSRSRRRIDPRDREDNYGIEYVTGTEEEVEPRSRRR